MTITSKFQHPAFMVAKTNIQKYLLQSPNKTCWLFYQIDLAVPRQTTCTLHLCPVTVLHPYLVHDARAPSCPQHPTSLHIFWCTPHQYRCLVPTTVHRHFSPTRQSIMIQLEFNISSGGPNYDCSSCGLYILRPLLFLSSWQLHFILILFHQPHEQHKTLLSSLSYLLCVVIKFCNAPMFATCLLSIFSWVLLI